METAKTKKPETLNGNAVSDNGCDGSSVCGDLGSGGRKRAPAVGLRGSRWRKYTTAELLAARTVKTATCWLVQGYPNPRNGYILIGSRPERVAAHRLAYELAFGPIPPDLKVLHRCDVPRCVNPEHLFLGTQHDNIHDCIAKGRRNAFGHQKLTVADVLDIRARAKHGEQHRVIAVAYGIARNTVTAIVNRTAWAHVPEPSSWPFERVPVVHVPIVGELDLNPQSNSVVERSAACSL